MDYFLLFLRERTAHSAEMIAASVRAMLQIISIISPIVNGSLISVGAAEDIISQKNPKINKYCFV